MRRLTSHLLSSSDQYFIRFVSNEYKENAAAYSSFSAKFALSGMTGTFNSVRSESSLVDYEMDAPDNSTSPGEHRRPSRPRLTPDRMSSLLLAAQLANHAHCIILHVPELPPSASVPPPLPPLLPLPARLLLRSPSRRPLSPEPRPPSLSPRPA